MKSIFFLFLICINSSSYSQVSVTKSATLMGSRWDITIVEKDSATALKYIYEVIDEVTRIELLISDWKPETQVSQINKMAGVQPVKVDKEVLELTQRAIQYSKISNGAFDISFAAMERIWKFDGSMKELPSPEAVAKAKEKVGYQNIIIDTTLSTIFLKEKGMKIGFGALGEGYAVDVCRTMMKQKGIRAGIVNGSGDMGAWGKQPNGKAWNIGITDPFEWGELYAVVPLEKGSVTTSGSYEKFAQINGKRYSHIINPATGYPATGLMSVTVFGPNTEQCNALSTSIMVLGKEAGIQLTKKYPAYKYIIVTDEKKIIKSKRLKLRKVDK